MPVRVAEYAVNPKWIALRALDEPVRLLQFHALGRARQTNGVTESTT